MNEAEEQFRELLTDCPFESSYRSEHRDEVRERALRAFDEAAAEAAPATVRLGDASHRQFTRRPAVRRAIAAVAAASVGAALVAWYGLSDKAASLSGSPERRAVTHSDTLARADRELFAALNQLSDFDEDRTAATFDLGVQACLSEHYSQIASTGEGS